MFEIYVKDFKAIYLKTQFNYLISDFWQIDSPTIKKFLD